MLILLFASIYIFFSTVGMFEYISGPAETRPSQKKKKKKKKKNK